MLNFCYIGYKAGFVAKLKHAFHLYKLHLLNIITVLMLSGKISYCSN